MKDKSKKKKFDCVEMKRKSAEIIYKRIKNMSPKEELDYWKSVDQKFKDQLTQKVKKSA